MSRTARNAVNFEIEGQSYLALFTHQHCDESRKKGDIVWVVEGNTVGTFRKKAIQRIIKPLVVTDENGYKVKARHLTKCVLFRKGKGSAYDPIGFGTSRCSVKDDYDWRLGIKTSLRRAITASRVIDPTLPSEGAFLNAYYRELKVRSEVEPAKKESAA